LKWHKVVASGGWEVVVGPAWLAF